MQSTWRYLLLLLALVPAARAQPTASPEQADFFEKRIRPLFVAHCYSCHSADAKKLRGDLRLDAAEHARKGGARGAVIVPGKPDESRLIAAVRYRDKDL